MFKFLRRMIVTWLFSDESPSLYIPSFVQHQDDMFTASVVRLFFIDPHGWEENTSYDDGWVRHKSGIMIRTSSGVRYLTITHTKAERQLNEYSPSSQKEYDAIAAKVDVRLNEAQKNRLWAAYTRWRVERTLLLTKAADASFDAALADERETLRNTPVTVNHLPSKRKRA